MLKEVAAQPTSGGKHKMKRFSFALLLCFAPIVVSAAPLRVVNVSAPGSLWR